MMWYQILSYLLTNTIQIVLCLCLIEELLNFNKVNGNAAILSLLGSGIVTVFYSLSLSQFWVMGIEIAVITVIAYYLFQEEIRMCIFLVFFYEVGTALWEFLVSAGLGILFQSQRFIDRTTTEHIIAVWLIRLFMTGIAAFIFKKRNAENNIAYRVASIAAVLGLLGIVILSEQTRISISDNQLTTWLILSLITMMSVLLFNLNRHYEMEKEIALMKTQQADLLERDYQTLNNTYAVNAKLFHDIQNHMEVMYQYLKQKKTDEAIQYLEDLRTPINEITQTVWTGDKAIDYLINSKIALAEQSQIQTKINIEFPSNTNIRSCDLTAILGNLLDNSLEAAKNLSYDLRFLYLTIRRINNMLVIKLDNGCETSPVIHEGELLTSKTDKMLHGWGLKSVRATAGHYDGTLVTAYEHNTFRAVVTLSFNPIKTE